MNKNEFADAVSDSCPRDLKVYVEDTLKLADELLRPERANVSKAVGFVARMASNLAKPEGEANNPTWLPLGAVDDLTSEYLSDKIEPWVITVRQEVFGSDDASFSTLHEAGEWMERQSKQDEHTVDFDFQAYRETLPQLMRITKRGSPGARIEYYRWIRYPAANGKMKHVSFGAPYPQDWSVHQMRESARGFSPLSWLGNETRIMERATGFKQPSLLMFILAGWKPLLLRYEAKATVVPQELPTGEQLWTQTVHLKIRAGDLSQAELTDAYHSARHFLRIRKATKRNPEHAQLYRLVRERGGPIKGVGAMSFWQSIQDELNRGRESHRKYRTWRGPRNAYNRLVKNLEDSALKIP
ncbi:MAG: hypothetical protein HQ553_04545 [Chloroflexi bacterium]|nr:hypothetical protein [Chloroflexota bacterium]